MDLNANFWTTLVSFLALILTQLPPVRLWWKRRKVKVDVFDIIEIMETVGAPGARLHLVLRNAGTREIKVDRLRLTFDSAGVSFTLDSRGYFKEPDDQQAIIFVPFSLAPGQEWSHIVNFFVFPPRHEAQRLKELGRALEEDINEKIRLRSADVPKEPVIAEEANYRPLEQLFDQKFKWLAGEYRLTLQVECEDKFVQRTPLNFVIFESDERTLRGNREHIRTGNGLFFTAKPYSTVVIPLSRS